MSGVFFPFKEECIEVDVSTIEVAPHCSRGRFAEGLQKVFIPRKPVKGCGCIAFSRVWLCLL